MCARRLHPTSKILFPIDVANENHGATIKRALLVRSSVEEEPVRRKYLPCKAKRYYKAIPLRSKNVLLICGVCLARQKVTIRHLSWKAIMYYKAFSVQGKNVLHVICLARQDMCYDTCPIVAGIQ